MRATGQTPPAFDPELVHGQLVAGFTRRYIEDSGTFGRFLFARPYNPKKPTCDYGRTYWPARPNFLSVPLATKILGKQHGLDAEEISTKFIEPFGDQSERITQALKAHPVMLVNGHDVELQGALALFAAGRGLAARRAGNEQANYRAFARQSHGIITRGIAPIVVGRPGYPGINFVRLCRLVVNPHMSFPNNEKMRAAAIPRAFTKYYNDRFRADIVGCARQPVDPALGLHQLWSLAPAGQSDKAGEGEYEGTKVTRLVTPGTIELMQSSGCALLPVRTKLGRGRSPSVLELGDIVPPEDVSADVIHDIMADLADFRRRNGQENVFYEGELSV